MPSQRCISLAAPYPIFSSHFQIYTFLRLWFIYFLTKIHQPLLKSISNEKNRWFIYFIKSMWSLNFSNVRSSRFDISYTFWSCCDSYLMRCLSICPSIVLGMSLWLLFLTEYFFLILKIIGNCSYGSFPSLGSVTMVWVRLFFSVVYIWESIVLLLGLFAFESVLSHLWCWCSRRRLRVNFCDCEALATIHLECVSRSYRIVYRIIEKDSHT